MRSRVTGSISPIDRPINYKGSYEVGRVYFPNELVEYFNFYWLYIYPIPSTTPAPTAQGENAEYWIKIGSSENPTFNIEAVGVSLSEITGLSASDVQHAIEEIYNKTKNVISSPATTESIGLVKVGDGLLPNTATGNLELLQSPYLDQRVATGPKNIFYVSTTGYDHPDASERFIEAAKVVKNNRQAIIDAAFASITMPSAQNNSTDINKCKRDIGFFVDAIAADLGNSTSTPSGFLSNLYAMQTAKAYYDIDGLRRITNAEITPTTQAFSTVAAQVITKVVSQYPTFVNTVTSFVNGLTSLVNGYLVNGLSWSAAPTLNIGVQRGRYIDGGNLITANKTYIIDTVLEKLVEEYKYSIPAEDKCRRDLAFIIDAVVKDVQSLSNTNVINIGRNYYGSDGLAISDVGSPSELQKTITAFRETKKLCMQAIQNKLPNTSDYSSVANDLNPTLFLPGGLQYEGSEDSEGSQCASVSSAAHTLFDIVIGYLENGLSWVNAPKQNPGLTRRSLPGQTIETSYKTVKRALAEVAKFPNKECTVKVASGKFYEDNPLVIPQPKTAVIGDNLRTTTICPLNHGKDLFKLDSGTYLNYLVFEDNYLGGFGILDSSTQPNPREITDNAITFKLFPGHTIKDVPGRFKDGANLVLANRTYIDSQVTNYNALFIIDAVIEDLKLGSNINSISAAENNAVVNDQSKIALIKTLIIQAIKGESETGFTGDIDTSSEVCANVVATAATLVELIAHVKNGGAVPPRDTGALILVNQEWMKIESLVGNVLNVSRGFNSAKTRHISGSKITQKGIAFRYAAAFKDGTNIFLSPYIQNCSNISVLGRTVLMNDGSGELDDTKTLAGGILVDGAVLANTSPIASMVMDAFTQIVSGSVGFHHKNDGYSQLVSVFQVFDDVGILCESGAYTSVTNSATNFGNTGLKAVGFSKKAFPFFANGTISSFITRPLSIENYSPATITKSIFTAEGNKTKVTLTIDLNKIAQFQVGQLIDVSAHGILINSDTGEVTLTPSTIANGVGLNITEVVASSSTISYLINQPFPSEGIAQGSNTGTVEIKQGKFVTEIAIQGFTSIPLPNYIVKIADPNAQDGFYSRADGIDYIVQETTPIENGICTITLQIPWDGEVPSQGAIIELRRPSTVNSSSHTFEFIGSGINYTALPENGGVTNPESQTVEVKSGRVYCSATDQDGNFTVGPFFRVDLKSGKITFTGTVSLGVIDEIQLKNSPGVPIRQFSIDDDLNGATGARHTRIATQKAVRDFVFNKLGTLFGRTIGNAEGQLVALGNGGKINADLIPFTNPFRFFTVETVADRLNILSEYPDIRAGDYVKQLDPDNIFILTRNDPGNGPEKEENWATLSVSIISASNIEGVISPAKLGDQTTFFNSETQVSQEYGLDNGTFLSGGQKYLPVVKSIKVKEELNRVNPIKIGSTSNPYIPNTQDYPQGSVTGSLEIDIESAKFNNSPDEVASSLGVARFAYEDFEIYGETVYLRDQAVELNEIKHITGSSVLGNDSTASGLVKELPLNEVVATVTTINVNFDNTNNQYVFTSNNINIGSTLYLTKGQTYKFVISSVGQPFEIALPSTSPYNEGFLAGSTNGTAITNYPFTKFIWTVPLNAPSKLRYQSSMARSTIGGSIITDHSYLGTAGRIQVNENLTNNTIDLVDVPQTDTNGTEGINFVQSISKDTYGRVTGRVIADIRTASTTRSGIVQLNSAVNDTSTTTAATPSAVKQAYDLADEFKGTVTSVGLSLPSIFTVGSTPITSSGTLTGTLTTQNANLVFAGPVTGSASTPGFRTLALADIPAGVYRKITLNAESPNTIDVPNTSYIEYTIVARTAPLTINLPHNPQIGDRVKINLIAALNFAVTISSSTIPIRGSNSNNFNLAISELQDIDFVAGISDWFIQGTPKFDHTNYYPYFRSASEIQSGIVQLTSQVNSTSNTTAATPLAVKTVYELANAAIPSSQKGQLNGVASLGADGLITSAQIPKSANIFGIASPTITLEAAHNGLILETTANSAVTLSLLNNLPAGFNCIIVQKGTGQITFTAASGVTLLHPDGHTRSAKRYATCTLYVSQSIIGVSAEYILSGNTVA